MKKKVIQGKRKTVGQTSQELLQKAALNPSTHSVEEQGREQLSEYEQNVIVCAQNWVKDHPKIDFFIVVLTKAERKLANVIRNYFMARFTCPLPNYDQTVFHYTHLDGNIRLLWTLPNRESCFAIKENPLQFPDVDMQLKKFIFEFADGTLETLAKKLNKEDVLKTGIVLEVKEEGVL